MTEDEEFNQAFVNKLSISNSHLDNHIQSTPTSTSTSTSTSTTTTKMASSIPASTTAPQVPLPPLPHQQYAQHLPHPQPPQSPPILSNSSSSSSQIQFGSDIHARLVAFQQKRSKPLVDSNNNSSSNHSNDATIANNSSNSNINLINHISNNNSSNSINYINNNINNNTNNNHNVPPLSTSISMINPPVNSEFNEKPLPPIPIEIANKRSFSTNDKELIQQQPPLSSSPSLANPTPGLLPSNMPLATTLSKKPSLSQRRGMKLNMNDLTKNISPLASPKNNPPNFDFAQFSTNASNNNGNNNILSSSNLSSTSSSTDDDISRKSSRRKPNFKLDLESDGSLSRGNSLNRTIDVNTPPPPSLQSDSDTNNNTLSAESEYDSDLEPHKPNGLFENYKKYIDIKSGRLNFSGKASLHSKGIDFSSGSSFRISLDELEYIDELGRGNYGSVSKVLHKPTGVLMAMKEVRLELDENKFTQILMELDILHKCYSPFIVDFYGAFFVEGAVYMCIEYMDGGSLDNVYGKDHGIKDEKSLAYITECVIRGLKELKDKHNIIHRDVKPTNILCNTQGKIKLCDFGVSGNLVSSLAKTNIGCQSYMAPERIKTLNPNDSTYSVQSDIWSLGLTILEIAEGQYPYPSETYDNIFSQLSAIVDGEPPKLDGTIFSKEAQIFVKSCLNKNPELRPSYSALLNSNWLVKYRGVDPHLDVSLSKRVEEINQEKLIKKNLINKKASATAAAIQQNQPSLPTNIETVQSLLRSKVKAPALHRGGLPSNKSFLNR